MTKWFYSSTYSKTLPSYLNVATSASKAGIAHALECERVHFGPLSLPSYPPGSLPLGWFLFPGPIWLHPFCLLHGSSSSGFQATLLIVYNHVCSTYFQSHLLRCGNFPNSIRSWILPSPPLQSEHTQPLFTCTLQSLQATRVELNPLNLFCLSALGQAV